MSISCFHNDFDGSSNSQGKSESFCGNLLIISTFVAVLDEQMKEVEGSRSEYEKEIEELKELLPEIREKIEDAKESQHSGNVAELALKATLVGLVSFLSFDNNMFSIVEGVVVLSVLLARNLRYNMVSRELEVRGNVRTRLGSPIR